MTRMSTRAMILQEQQEIYDEIRMHFRGMGSGNRYSHAQKEFTCDGFNRLPDVTAETSGQVFAALRRPVTLIPHDGVPGIMGADGHSCIRRPMGKVRTRHCRAILPKGKQQCDECRTGNRQQSRRECMRGYMERRRAPVDIGSEMASTCARTRVHAACGDERTMVDQSEQGDLF